MLRRVDGDDEYLAFELGRAACDAQRGLIY
jgi:hypothetical protein